MLPSAEDTATIAATPLFLGLSAEATALILRGATVRQFDEDTLLFSAGDPADRFHVTLKGSVRLFALNREGDEAIIEVVSAGHSFAEAALFGPVRYPVNAEAMAGARVAAIAAAPSSNCCAATAPSPAWCSLPSAAGSYSFWVKFAG